MSVLTDQQTSDAQFNVAVTLWDPDLSWASQRSGAENPDNSGCPPGYGCVYTAGGKICRSIGSASPAIIQQDAAPGFVDASIINIADATRAVAGGAGQVVQTVGSGIAWTLQQASQTLATLLGPLAPWLVGGGLLYLYMTGGFEAGQRTFARVSRNPRLTRAKARLILHHGHVRGHRLTEAQRRWFGARASGYPVRKRKNPFPLLKLAHTFSTAKHFER